MSEEMLERALDAQEKTKRVYITIEPFFDPNVANMGLEKYGKVVFDGVKQIEDLGSRKVAGVERYINGLDEFAPEVKSLPDEEKRAKVLQIRETVAKLEMELAQNLLDVKDPEFWSKVVLLGATNVDFWSQVQLTVGSDPVSLDPGNPSDVIKIFAIEAGGFNLVAPSLEMARKSNKGYKFYLSRLEDTSAIRTEIKKLKNKARGMLDVLRESKQNKLFLVSKIYLSAENNFTRSTPIDVLYDKIDDRIDGIDVKSGKKKLITDFISIAGMENKDLLISAYVKDAIFYRTLAMKSDKYYYTPLGSLCGKSVSECVEFFKNPLNEKELEELIERIEKRWN